MISTAQNLGFIAKYAGNRIPFGVFGQRNGIFKNQVVIENCILEYLLIVNNKGMQCDHAARNRDGVGRCI